MTELVIRFPAPDSRLLPNRRRNLHWAVLHKLEQDLRLSAWAATRETIQREDWRIVPAMPKWPLAQTKPTWFLTPRQYAHTPDGDNLAAALKYAWDGLEAAGIVTNDRNFVHWPVQTRRLPPKVAPYVVVLVSPILEPLAQYLPSEFDLSQKAENA